MPRGRPTKYHDERVSRIVRALADGNTRRAACLGNGVSEDTFAIWMREYSDFSDAVTLAEFEAEQRYVSSLKKAAFGHQATKTKRTTKADGSVEEVRETVWEFDWKAAESWLKRRRPDEWGDRVDVRQLPDDALVRLLNRAAGRRGLGEGTANADTRVLPVADAEG